MKIQSLEITDFAPIKNLKIDNIGNVMIIAGANGAGKTRLKEAIVSTFQGNGIMSLTLEATREREIQDFGGPVLKTIQGNPNNDLSQYMQSRRFGRGQYVGSLVQIDSHRNIQTTQYHQVNYQVADPDDQDTGSTFYYQNFTNRWQDFMNYIHQKVAAYQNQLATQVLSGEDSLTAKQIKERLPHPLDKYKTIFKTLLPGKELMDINPSSPGQFQYQINGSTLPFSSLSSGEQEVVKVIFDVERKDIKDSIIIVDEPELHLHPTLTFKLVETLKTVGDNTNQFIFLTHSADLISTYYSTGNVYFIDAEQTGANQAHRLSDLNHSHKDLVEVIGENLGLFAVGKKLVFIEGEDSSIDRLTYHTISQKYLPEAKIIHAGSVGNLIKLSSFEEQIRSSIFGIDFYMIRDRDCLTDEQVDSLEANGRLRCLKKRHIENYFLDSEILLKVANAFYITTTKPEVTQPYIEEKLKEIAVGELNFNLIQNTKDHISLNSNFDIPSIRSVNTKSITELTTEFSTETISSLNLFSANITQDKIETWMSSEKVRLETSLTDGTWKSVFQGKTIFSKFCSSIFSQDKFRIRQAYLDIALVEKPEIFEDIKDIFASFS